MSSASSSTSGGVNSSSSSSAAVAEVSADKVRTAVMSARGYFQAHAELTVITHVAGHGYFENHPEECLRALGTNATVPATTIHYQYHCYLHLALSLLAEPSKAWLRQARLH